MIVVYMLIGLGHYMALWYALANAISLHSVSIFMR